MARVRLKPAADSDYFNYVYFAAYSVKLNLRSIKQTTGIQNLDAEAYFDEFAPLPPLAEQRAIVAYLDQETSQIDTLVATIRTQIERLRVYRQALISAAVTGKIDVREIKLGAEAEES